MIIHRHILVRANVARPPRDAATVADWLRRLVAAVDMKVFFGPEAIRCDTLGNEGVTGVIGLETSHASIHCWDTSVEQPYLTMDLYSCANYEVQTVLDFIREFEPVRGHWALYDRDDIPQKLIAEGYL